MKIEITPDPSDEERAAIVEALAQEGEKPLSEPRLEEPADDP